MSGSIAIVISEDSKKFKQIVDRINDSLDNYRIPRYEPNDADLLKEVFGEKQSHFILHSDLVGDYVPVFFENRVVPDWFLTNLGSSIHCCNELEEMAHKLKLSLGSYTPNFQILYEQRFDDLADDILYPEKFMLLELYNIMLASIKHNLLISFH